MPLSVDAKPSVQGAQGPGSSLEQQNRGPTVIGYFSTGKPMYQIEGGCTWIPTKVKKTPAGNIIYQEFKFVPCEKPDCKDKLPVIPESQEELPEPPPVRTLAEYLNRET